MSRLLIVLAGAAFLAGCHADGERAPEMRWWKGNTHTHTLWSDGDAAPEAVVAWYREHGYQFLALSDHNVLQEGERWFPVAADGKGRLNPAELEGLIQRFGADAVTVREVDGRREMRLLALDELRARFETPGEFVLITGEEITAGFRDAGEPPRDHPVHVNALNIAACLPAPAGDSIVDVMNRAVDAVVQEGEATGRPVLAHVNHPNFGWGLTWRDLAQVRGGRFFEVLNGHRGVANHGDATHPGTEEMWDRALVLRLTELALDPLYALATDDAHNYFGKDTAQPGRGWVMVRAPELSAAAIIAAMRHGDFYASSGVTLSDVTRGDREYRVAIHVEEDVSYTTRFVGTRRTAEGIGPVGEVFLETDTNPAVYRYRGDELYVRAVVVSSRDHPNPFAAGDKEMAWTQPAAGR
ncbi:MAG: hypothetical protein AB1726_02120 [Planctomycetota bacterium]